MKTNNKTNKTNKTNKNKYNINLGLIGLIFIMFIGLAFGPTFNSRILEGNTNNTDNRCLQYAAPIEQAEDSLKATIVNRNEIKNDPITNITANAMFEYTSIQSKSNQVIIYLALSILIVFIIVFFITIITQ